MVFTRGTSQPPPPSASSIRVGKQPATLIEQPEESQSDQNSPDTTVLLSLVQTMQQQIDTLLQRDVERGNSQSMNITLPPLDNSYIKDPRDRIKHADVPKYDGTKKDAES